MTTAIRLAPTAAYFFVLACSLFAGDRQITIKTPDAIYMATVDDSLSQRMNLQLLPVFSPLVITSPPPNPYLTGVSTSFGKTNEHDTIVYDKLMIAPQLEDCQSGRPNCPPTFVNDAFLRNAEANIEKGRKQVGDLKQERLPESLDPVRRFLLDNLTTSLREQEARYEYIRTGAVAPLKALLDQYCTTDQQGLIRKLEETTDAEMRRELARHDWGNAVLQCYEVHIGKYPMEAWKRFTRQYRVRENPRSTVLDP
ncbi:MAG TPA: hypothetical protein VHY84_03140 [Bryobacteraceae bacterium]|nr:hypothetical protein [Bryobacteraceae bacterium]